MILCMTEKPSVAVDVGKVLGLNVSDKRKGYFEGNGYIVTWCVGHLVSLAEPDCYTEYGYLSLKEAWANPENGIAQLPLFPDKWKYTVIESSKKQFEIVKHLIWRDDVTKIYDLGDCGSEGIVLQSLVRMQAGNGWGFNDGKKPVYRWNTASMTDEAITDALKNIIPPDEAQRKYMPVIQAEMCKKRADWILGMSMSRAESLKYNADIRVGRVQSPTLAFVVSRYIQVQNFKVSDYYTMQADVASNQGNFSVYWKKDDDSLFPASIKDSEQRVLDKAAVDAKAREIELRRTGTITDFTDVSKKENPPQLYDTAELEADANRKYGYSAALTLSAAQALYEHYKVTTYPRTDSRYLTTDLKSYLPKRLEQVGTIDKYASGTASLLKNGLNIGNRIIDDAKVDDHHAIIPTENINGFDYALFDSDKTDGLTPEVLKNVLDMILTRFIVALCPNYEYKKSNVEVTFSNGIKMTASGTIPLSLGWRGVQESLNGKEESEDASEADAEQVFPNIQKGDSVTVSSCRTLSKKTTPPKYHTEATLLKAMLNAGSTIANGEILRGRGIGTQATRAEIIAGLFKTEVVETLKKGKTNYIVPTVKGLSVIRCLPSELYSPKITAEWETKIYQITHGEYTPQEFMSSFRSFITEKVDQVNKMEVAALQFKKQRESYGNCPFCGKPVYRKDERKGKGFVYRFFCSSRECHFGISTDNNVFIQRLGKRCTPEQIHTMIETGSFTTTYKRTTGARAKVTFHYEADYKTVSGETIKVCKIIATAK